VNIVKKPPRNGEILGARRCLEKVRYFGRLTGLPSSPGVVTQLLRAWGDGDAAAFEQLAPLVEAELRRLARGYMARERQGHTLQTTALVNEAFLRLTQKNHRPESLRFSAQLPTDSAEEAEKRAADSRIVAPRKRGRGGTR
jgi:hypothetical protein